MNNVIVAGAGTFGTAVAERLSWNISNRVTLHTIEKDVEKDINEYHMNRKYFPILPMRLRNFQLRDKSDLNMSVLDTVPKKH